MFNFRKVLILCAFLFVFTGCDDGVSSSDEQLDPDIQVPKTEGFAIQTIETADGIQLVINNDALEREFLIQSSFAQQKDFGSMVGNPTSTGMKTRVVVFKKEGDQIAMLDVDRGVNPGDELSATLLVTTFPIVSENMIDITFDFNKGMNNFLPSWGWYVSDFYGNVIEPDLALEINSSYIENQNNLDNAITFEHIINARDGSSNVPFKITYYITEYIKNEAFTSTESPGVKFLGYFEAMPLAREGFGSTYTLISKWDVSKPITYYVSNDTPDEYKEAVRKGILYWNKAFGKEVLKAEIAPAGVTAPSFDHNIIQWHTNNYTGAYADAICDPLSGEILHTQVFLGSAYAEWSKAYSLNKIDRTLDINGIPSLSKEEDNEVEYSIFAKDLNQGRLDVVYFSDIFNGVLDFKETISSLPKEKIDAITNNLITWVTAHEVGHTLGLRHNFASSTVNPMTSREHKEMLRNYLSSGVLPEDYIPTNNSLMEYPHTADEITIGAYIADDSKPALSHDQYAIQWAYFNYTEKPKYEGHAFCTDSDIGRYADCQQNDGRMHFVERYTDETLSAFENLPRFLAEIYFRAKAHLDSGSRRLIEEATPSTWQLAGSVFVPFYDLNALLTKDFKLKSIHIKHNDLTDIDSDLIEDEHFAWLNNEISFANKENNIFNIMNPEYFESTIDGYLDGFETIIKSDEYIDVPLYGGGETSFTENEISYMLSRATTLFPMFKDNLAFAISSILNMGKLKPIDTIEDVEGKIANWIGYILTRGNKPSTFSYSYETRKRTADLLFAQGPFMDWLMNYIPAIADALYTKYGLVFGKPIEEVYVEDYPREKQAEIAAELDLFYYIASKLPVLPPIVVETEEEDGEAVASTIDE